MSDSTYAEKSAGGLGSISILLIFAVLCMTFFAVISLQSALAGKSLTDAQERLVKAYYDADSRAERIISEILDAPAIPEAVDGIMITVGRGAGRETVSFSCPMPDQRELAVEAAVYETFYEIIRWQMRDAGEWATDDSLPVWQGDSN